MTQSSLDFLSEIKIDLVVGKATGFSRKVVNAFIHFNELTAGFKKIYIQPKKGILKNLCCKWLLPKLLELKTFACCIAAH